MNGISLCRNPNLANVFYRLELIEAYGTGIVKIMSAYSGYAIKPSIVATRNTLKITLPNLFAEKASQAKEESLSIYEKEVIAYLEGREGVSRSEVQALLGVGQSCALNLLRSLTEKGMIASSKKGRTPFYSLKK